MQIFKSRISDQKCASRIFVLNLSEEFHRKILRKKGVNGWRVLEMSSQSVWLQSYSIGNSRSVGLPQFVGKPNFQKCLLGCGNVCFYFSLFLFPHLICFLRLCSYNLRHLFLDEYVCMIFKWHISQWRVLTHNSRTKVGFNLHLFSSAFLLFLVPTCVAR